MIRNIFTTTFLIVAATAVKAQLGVSSTAFETMPGVSSPIGRTYLGQSGIAHTFCSPVTCVYTVLPIISLHLSGVVQPAFNHLYWHTYGETNMHRYTIDRSGDNSNYVTIGSLPSLNIPGSYRYEYKDSFPLPGNNFYRIRAIDTDSSFIYSNTILLKNNRDSKATIYPNPAGRIITLRLTGCDANTVYFITLQDMEGRNHHHTRFVSQAGVNIQQMDVSGLGNGTYLIGIVPQNSGTRQFIKATIIH
ncbi:MAG: T9SS type A sorting domain-containing protein [Ferruginibacter sp.]